MKKLLLILSLAWIALGVQAQTQPKPTYKNIIEGTGVSLTDIQILTLRDSLQKAISPLGMPDESQFMLYDLGFYPMSENIDGEFDGVWKKVVDSLNERSNSFILIGRESRSTGINTAYRIKIKLPTSPNFPCYTEEMNIKIESGISGLISNTESKSAFDSELLAIQNLRNHIIRIASCACNGIVNNLVCTQVPNGNIKDILLELAAYDFRLYKVEHTDLAVNYTNANSKVYDFHNKKFNIQGVYYESFLDSLLSYKLALDNAGYYDDDSVYVNVPINGKVLVLDQDSWLNGEWKQALADIKVFDYVQLNIVLYDPNDKCYYVHICTSYKGTLPKNQYSQYIAINNNKEWLEISPIQILMNLAKGAAIDVLMQSVMNMFTDDKVVNFKTLINSIDWASAAKSAAWSALGGIIPIANNDNVQSITEACYGSFKLVSKNVNTIQGYTFVNGFNDFVSSAGEAFLKDLFFRGATKVGIKSATALSSFTVKSFNKAIGIIDKYPQFKKLKDLFTRTKWKCLLNGGCFTPNTPVYASNYNFKNVTTGLAMASVPAIALTPIQDISLLDNVVAHKTVNAGYGITASTDIYTGITDHDPYTSTEQIQRDKQNINTNDWNEVTLQEVNGSSTCKLALTTAWTLQNGYTQDAIIEMNLPEQGIAGPFRITSIKHVLPQKIPESPNSLAQDFDFRPVTGIFTHWSDKVLSIRFESGDTLGVTESHPIYSTTHAGWRIALELLPGEQVLTYTGTSTIVAISTDATPQLVYNLEVKDLHNFLVGSAGVLVHNHCFEAIDAFIKDNPILKDLNLTRLYPGKKFSMSTLKADYNKIKTKFGLDNVCFDDLGFPDFSPFVPLINGVSAIVEIDMNGDRLENGDYLKAAQSLCAKLGIPFQKFHGGATFSGKDNITYTWHHHQDGKTMMLVPTDIHSTSHSGGVKIAVSSRNGKNYKSLFPSPSKISSYLTKCK
jgi:hypothetical protein